MSTIVENRERISRALANPGTELIAIGGPCAPLEVFAEQCHKEADSLHQLQSLVPRLITMQSLPMWKPRSVKGSWAGEETTNPDGAMRMIRQHSEMFGSTSMELGLGTHVSTYGRFLSFGWFGARNTNEHMKTVTAVAEPNLPLGVKNGLDGEIEPALAEIERIREARGPNAAPVALVYRGGTNAQTPEEWSKQYRDAFDATGGQLIVDIAHGSEMAHDPEGNFQKTVEGQIACLNHVSRLILQGFIPAGIKMEASNTPQVIDPPMPFEKAIEGIIELTEQIKEAQRYPAFTAVREAQARQHEARILNASFGNVAPGYEQQAPQTKQEAVTATPIPRTLSNGDRSPYFA